MMTHSNFMSERLDSNQRPPVPKTGAIPGYATLRYLSSQVTQLTPTFQTIF